MPNYDVWYPLGISATIYSIMTLWLAIKRFVKKLRRLMGLPTEREESVESMHPARKIQLEYPIAATTIKPLELSAREVPKNNL